MSSRFEKKIFRKGSTTFFFSSLLFPRGVRKDVFDLYSFLRVADDYVDESPARPEKLAVLIKLWEKATDRPSFDVTYNKNDTLNQRVVKNIIRLQREKNFKDEWIQNFLETMQSDVDFQPKDTLEDSLEYSEGSAEVVGLMMSRIMGLPKHFDKEAKMLGRAFQWMNFIRDIEEDNQLRRCYFPRAELQNFKLDDLSEDTAYDHETQFKDFVKLQIHRYEKWRDEAVSVFKYMPRRLRIPLQVATDLFDWTVDEIYKDPLIVFSKKIKPSRTRIIIFVFKRAVSSVR